METLASSSPPTLPVSNTSTVRDFTLLRPETRPITLEQLMNEPKDIYAILAMAKKNWVEIDQRQSITTNKLSNEQCQDLVALHRTSLHEHHDFFLASQHPSSLPALRCLPSKYATPARMWRQGIHNFLELLRYRLPDSLDEMLKFFCLAYPMMALLTESVPSFEETRIKCLRDLARYQMAIEEDDFRDREVRSDVARVWYNKATDKSPNVGRIQHNPAQLARPNVVQQLFYYSKALVWVTLLQNTRGSIMLFFDPFLEGFEIDNQRHPLVKSALVKINGILFTHGFIFEYASLMDQFLSILDNQTGLIRTQLPAYQGSGGQEEASLGEEDARTKHTSMIAYWASLGNTSEVVRANPCLAKGLNPGDIVFLDSDDTAAHTYQSLGETISVVSQRIGDKNILPYMHVILASLFGLVFVPNTLIYFEDWLPWENIVISYNTLGHSGVVEARFEGAEFPQQMSATGRQLPKDFVIRGLKWAQYYFPSNFLESNLVDEDERSLELPSHAAPRVERFQNLGPMRGIHGSRLLKLHLYAHIECLLLTCARGWVQAVVDFICLTFSTFMQHSSEAAKLFLIGSLPVACAAPAGDSTEMGDIPNPGAWLDFGTTCHILGWAFASVSGGLVYYLGVRGPRKDLARYYVLSFGSAGASLVLLDARAAPEVRWPALIVGVLFLVRLWAKVSEVYKMGYGWLGPILGLGIVIDTSLVHLTVGATGGDPGLFLQLLLASVCIALSLCALLARCHHHINANSRLDDMV